MSYEYLVQTRQQVIEQFGSDPADIPQPTPEELLAENCTGGGSAPWAAEDLKGKSILDRCTPEQRKQAGIKSGNTRRGMKDADGRSTMNVVRGKDHWNHGKSDVMRELVMKRWAKRIDNQAQS
tara:strand:- start:121 stop:489 length:369 start_codon:yes stop_codon:yes gene_type:complete